MIAGAGIHAFSGLQVYSSVNAVETIESKLTWVDRVIAWNPCNNDLMPKKETRPACYQYGGKLIAHPSIIADLRNLA